MRKLLLTAIGLLAASFVFAQKVEITAGVYSGLFKFSGASAASSSFINAGTNSAFPSYTNNPYGSKLGIGFGVSGQAQLVGKGGLILGLQLAYEQLKSKVDINQSATYNPISSTPSVNSPANGSTSLKNDIINLSPYIGYRIPLTKIKIDILAGTDIGFINSTREKGSATSSTGTTYSTNLDRSTIKKDYRLRVGLAANLNKFSLTASYAHGLRNYMEGYVGGSPEAYSRVIRVGLGYRVF